MNSNEFVRADSRNLPSLDAATMIEYFQNSDKYNAAEIKGVKALMASRSGYVDNAIGYVEIRREAPDCIVKAKVVPEHKVTKKYYQVTVQLNENENCIIDTTCDGCAASEGGCKHSLVVLFWLEKKTIEPSPTSVECYWAKPRLASEGTEPILSKDLVKSRSKNIQLGPRNPQRLIDFYEECKKRKIQDSVILSFLPEHYENNLNKYCIFDLILKFVTEIDTHNESYENFKNKMSSALNADVISEIEKTTKKQAESKFWHNIRQGRITGSKIYDICHCNTPDGSLVEQILGGYKVYETNAMKRGKSLEKCVVKELEKRFGCQIKEAGFKLINLISGASPDGISDNFIIEIKCPSSSKTVKNYLQGNKIKEKYFAQCQFEMLATSHKQCAFCIADPKFEDNKKIIIMWVDFDAAYVNTLVRKSEEFWIANIYPKILDNAKS